MMFATPIEVIQHVKSGKLRVLGTTAAHRLAAMPDVPTIAESGYPGFEVYSFFGMLAPAGTPPAIVERLHTELAAVMQLPDVKERFAQQSAEANVLDPAAFGRFLAAQRDKWQDVVKRTGAKVE
jgi:tripartite-type tricarboxylate transporter receptor subunit TctC